MTLDIPRLAVGTFTTTHATWQEIFDNTGLSNDRADRFANSPTDLLSAALAITPSTAQPDPHVECPFRFTFPSYGLLDRGSQGVVTSEVTVFRKLAAHNVLVELWNTVAANLKRDPMPFPHSLVKKPTIQALSRFYRVWHAAAAPSIKPDLPPDLRRGPLTKCAERCVWAMLHFAILGATTSWRHRGTASELQSRLARTAFMVSELKGVTTAATPPPPSGVTRLARTLETRARGAFLDTLVCKVARHGGWFDSIDGCLDPRMQAQILVTAADSAITKGAIGTDGNELLTKTATALRAFVQTSVDTAYNLELVYNQTFPGPDAVAGRFQPLTIETQSLTGTPQEWGWWGEPVEL